MEYQSFAIDHIAEEKLGIYVYALIDPRDRKIFYVGQGRRNRINGHFVDTKLAMTGEKAFTSKLRRIENIWEEGLQVEIQIIRRNLPSDSVADHVESGCISILGLSQNGITYNLNSGPQSVGHGSMSIEEMEMLNAPPVSPAQAVSQVYIFNSNADTHDSDVLYASVRGDWTVSKANLDRVPAFAVALSKGVSKQVYKIEAWEPSGNKFRFLGKPADSLTGDLVHKNWSSILGLTSGYWIRGQYLIINFNGSGQFQFARGLASDTWFDL